MKAHSGEIVKLNLANSKIDREPSLDYFDKFPGGRGLNQYLLFKELLPGTAPFDPSNVVIFGAGLLVGTGAPGDSRLNIDSLSPYTGGIGSSNVGGNFAVALRAAGIDHFMVKGRSKQPVYIFIDDGQVILRDASHLRGKGTLETEKIIKEELKIPDLQILAIGPAGENLVRPSSIMVNTARAAARCGLGAVMGSKNLKAIAVRGRGTIEPKSKKHFQKKANELITKLKENEFNKKRMKYGVYCYDPWIDETPYRNFQGGLIPDEKLTAKIRPDVFLQYKKGTRTCNNCPIRCWGVYEFQDKNGIVISEALQGNDPHNFAAKLNIFDARDILKAHAICNNLGLDVDNVAGTIAWAFECYQRGILSEEETDGLKLEWGNSEVVFTLLNKIAYREGFGDILAEGSRRAAEILGKGHEYSINIKGQDLMESLRSSVSWALGTAVAARGGTHTRGAVIEGRLQNLSKEKSQQIFGITDIGRPDSYEGKEKMVHFFERLEAMMDCLGICMFTNSLRVDMVMPEDLAELLSLATGLEVSTDEFMWLGEKVHTQEKCFNVLHRGWTRIHDYPPDRFFDEPIVNGPMEGQSLDREKWGRLLDRYYDIHGWDKKTGWPRKETLLKLGLEEIADKLAKYNRLPE